MSEKDVKPTSVDEDDDDDDDEDDVDFCPTKNVDEASGSSDQSDHEEEQEEKGTAAPSKQAKATADESTTAKPYDASKTEELWKGFSSSKPKTDTPPASVKEDPKPISVEKKVFEFAGEKISVPVPVTSNPSSLKRPASSSSTGSGSILDRLGIGKKQKLSTLEKSRLDWQAHKEAEALTDDLQSHRRSKDSYVEKQAFLQRTETREHDHYLTQIKKK